MFHFHFTAHESFCFVVLQVDAALNVNPKLKLNPRNQEIVLYAITRIDLSKNSLTWLPPILFQLPSLRYVAFQQMYAINIL